MRSPAPRPAACVSPRAIVQRAAQRAVEGGGGTIEPLTEVPARLDAYGLVIVDGIERGDQASARAATGVPIMVLAEALDDDRAVEALGHASVNHLAPGEPEDTDVRHLRDTTSKLQTDDIFGLERYLDGGDASAPEAHPERAITTTEDKRRAIDELGAYCRGLGLRRPLIQRVEAALDELLMNAMYDAPAAAGVAATPALATWSNDARYLAVAVTDRHGSLQKSALVASILRARRCAGQPRTEPGSVGAGLGVYLVLAHCTRFVVNLAPGERTEVICLFDRHGVGRMTSRWTRSIDVFVQRR